MSKAKTTSERPRAKRPPRNIWIVWRDDAAFVIPAAATTRKHTTELLEEPGERVVGPYCLLERVRER